MFYNIEIRLPTVSLYMNPIFHAGTICLTDSVVSMWLCNQNINLPKNGQILFYNFRVYGAQGKKLENLKKEFIELTVQKFWVFFS